MLASGTILQGRYRIISQLGQGGMGAVYEAVDERLDTTVALKETLFAEERLRKQFEREARLLARLHHPALPRVSDHFAEGDGEFLVMQYIPGQDLAEMIASRSGPFPPEQVLPWADQLLDALDYLHTQDPQIIHRDIKPQNLKLTARGQIVLLDFGLAKGQAGDISRLTTAASIFGYTPNYAPLEQVQGLGTDPRSDLYALAATLYHLLTGTKPPDALTRAAAIVNSQPDPLRPANEERPIIDPQIAEVLRRALAQNRDQRFASAAEMRRVLMGRPEAVPTKLRGEANTVLFPSATAKTVSAQRSTAQTDPVTGETTVVRNDVRVPPIVVTPPTTQKRGVGVLGVGATAVVVLAAGVGGYYAYQHRGSAAGVTPVNTSTPQAAEVPAAPTETKETDAKSSDSEKSPESQPHLAPKKEIAKKVDSARKQDAAAKEAEAAAKKKEAEAAAKKKEEDTAAAAKQAQGRRRPNPPDPDAPPEDQKNGRRPNARRMPNGGSVVTYPNGTKVTTAPNGARVVQFPDGTVRVFNPGKGPRRRPNP